MAPSRDPESTLVYLLTLAWNYAIWNAKLEEHVNIFKYHDFHAESPPESEEFILIWTAGASRTDWLGRYDHAITLYPLAIEVQSRRPHEDAMAWSGLTEALRIMRLYRKTVGTYVPGYRKIWIQDKGEPIHTRQMEKWLTKVELQESLETL